MKTMRAASLGLALVSLAACSNKDKQAQIDSTLEKDLALANAQSVQPTFQDTAVAPAPAPASAAPQAPPAPRRTHTAPRPRPTPPPPPREVAQAPAAEAASVPAAMAPAPGPKPVATIGAGTSFGVSGGSKVCTSAQPGEKFVATINNDITGTNGAVIPAGSSAVIEVASMNPGDNADNATIAFRVKSIVVGAKTYDVTGDASPEGQLEKTKINTGSSDKKKVIGGAIAGAVLGQIIGHNTKGTVIGAAGGAAAGAAAAKMTEKWEACLPEGAPLRVTLSSSLPLT